MADSENKKFISGDMLVGQIVNEYPNAVTTFPFYTLEGWNMKPPAISELKKTDEFFIIFLAF